MKEDSAPDYPDEIVLTEKDPCVEGQCQERLCGRMRRELAFFRFLAEEDLDEVAGYFECRQLQSGSQMWREGDSADFAVFIVSGKIEVNKSTQFGAKPIVVGIYSRGSTLGESSLLDERLRAVNAKVLDHADLIILTRQSYKRLIRERPALGARILEGLLASTSRRLHSCYDRLTAIF